MDRLRGARSFDVPSSENPTNPLAPDSATAPEFRRTWASNSNCPLHIVMERLAHLTVSQKVLHLQGERLPRLDLVDALEGWQQLYRLVLTRVCPATREIALSSADLATLVHTAVPRLLLPSVPTSDQNRLIQRLMSCASCASAAQCPLGLLPRHGHTS
jgi:hypothetical protein